MSDPTSNVPSVALVFVGGDPLPDGLAEHLPHAALVIAADSGLRCARQVGRRVDLVVGDLDSVDPDDLAAAEAAGASVERHAEAKDATDLELAFAAAVDRGATRIVAVGGHGGRLDHFLANLLLFASPRFREVAVEAWIGEAHVHVVRSRVEIRGAPGSYCTLLALGGAAEGVTTTGLAYPLDDEALMPGSTRGVSNELCAPVATVSVRHGTLLVIQPHGTQGDG